MDDRQRDRLRKKGRKERDKLSSVKKDDADARPKKSSRPKDSERSQNRAGRFASDYVGSGDAVVRGREIQSEHTSITTEIEAGG